MDATHISRFLIGLGRVSAQSGILVVLILTVQRVFRKQLAARWHCALWILLALRLALPFSFSSFTSVFNLLPRLPQQPRESISIPIAAEVSEPVPAKLPMALRYLPDDPASPEVPQVVEAPARAPRWPVWIFIAWLGGAVFLAGQIVISSARLRAWCRKLEPWSDSVAIAALEDCCERMQVRTKPALLESPEVKSPALHGFLRPRLLLPKGFADRFSRAELQFVFLHELAHLKRRDLLLNWVMAALQVAHWFNPLVWLGFSRWRADREIACDAMVLEAVGQGRNREYGRTILRLLENFARPVSTPGLVGIMEDKRQLRRRIDMIASFIPTKKWSVLALLLAIGLAAVGLTDARSQVQSGGLLSTANSQQQSGYDVHPNDQNPISQGAGVTLVATPATSNFSSWHAQGQAQFDSPSNWTAATSNFNAWQAEWSNSMAPAPNQSGSDLTGAWVLVGTPDKVGKVPASGGRLKFFVGNCFCVTQADPKTGVVLFHHGGTYAVTGDEYRETVKYANPSTMNFIGGTNGHFNIKVEGDTMTLIGIGNPWKEVWKRVEKVSPVMSPAARDMIGAWVLVGKPGETGEVPETGAGYKFITYSDWCDTQADPKTGVVVIHHGGTWAFKGNDYVETVEYANPVTMNLIGHDFKFNAKVEGDTLTLMGIDNPWNEVWKRVR